MALVAVETLGARPGLSVSRVCAGVDFEFITFTGAAYWLVSLTGTATAIAAAVTAIAAGLTSSSASASTPERTAPRPFRSRWTARV